MFSSAFVRGFHSFFGHCIPIFPPLCTSPLLGRLFVPLCLCTALLSFYREQFLCFCLHNIASSRATSTHGIERQFQISWHTRLPERQVYSFCLHGRTWRDEHECPSRLLVFSSQLIADFEAWLSL